MTHAALKDLLPCPFCGETAIVREPGSDDGFAIHIHCRCGVTMLGKRNHFSTAAEAITAWNRRAVLSAMEGEAAVEILGWKDNASPRLRFLTKVDRLTAGTILYTAPPPQQAEADYVFPPEVAEWFGVAHGYPRSIRAATDERDELLRDYVKVAKAIGFAEYADFEHILAAVTHLTPSPGPQGGGEALVDRIAYALAAHEVWGGQVTPGEALKDEKMRDECYSRAELVAEMISTPPAHQPGEVDMELVEEGLRYFEMTGDKGDERYTREIRKAFAALAPKENPT